MGTASLRATPSLVVASRQRPRTIRAERRMVGRVQSWRQVEERLVGIELGAKVLPGQTPARGPVTPPLFLLGGRIPGAPLLLGERLPDTRGAPKRPPGVALHRAAKLPSCVK